MTLPRPPRNAIKFGHWNSIHSRTSTRSFIHLAYAFLKLVRMLPEGEGERRASYLRGTPTWTPTRTETPNFARLRSAHVPVERVSTVYRLVSTIYRLLSRQRAG